jgi:hypothetical protein
MPLGDVRWLLRATTAGWECPSPVCEYAQDWAWSWMADWSWRRHDTG